MRTSGVLMHLSSLPSPYGIGTMGKEAYRFVDFLEKAGQTYWQMLPVGPTSYGDSPYQSFSGYAGNPYFVDLDMLVQEGLLSKEEILRYQWGSDPESVDYGILYENRFQVLKMACDRLVKKQARPFRAFCKKQQAWLDDYALFMAEKDAHGGKSWMEWEKPLRFREEEAIRNAKKTYADKITFYQAVQYLFFRQWEKLKTYANKKGIKIIGDVPIYVASDSADVWTEPELFMLDKNLQMTKVAGCPPDAFSATGQRWGNPLYRWDVMKKQNYDWWVRRVQGLSERYDIVRIDHFRAFDSYYAIPAKDKTAENGKWMKGPGIELFHVLEKKLGKPNIIVEDLGYLTPSVMKLVKDSGFPGMKVLQFAFDTREDGDYLPHNYPSFCVVYTGTHDNDTINGWMKSAPKESVKNAKEYLNLTKEEGYHWGMMRGAWSSVGDTVIVTMQDLLGLGGKARMNMPSTLGTNWKWRAKTGSYNAALAKKIAKQMQLFGRMREGSR